MKRILVWAVVGAGVGDLVGVLMGARFISWWMRSPGVTDQDRCVGEVDAALALLAKGQGVAALVGVVLFVIIGIIWSRRRSAVPTATKAVD